MALSTAKVSKLAIVTTSATPDDQGSRRQERGGKVSGEEEGEREIGWVNFEKIRRFGVLKKLVEPNFYTC